MQTVDDFLKKVKNWKPNELSELRERFGEAVNIGIRALGHLQPLKLAEKLTQNQKKVHDKLEKIVRSTTKEIAILGKQVLSPLNIINSMLTGSDEKLT